MKPEIRTPADAAVSEWQFGNPDDELLPVTRCACGQKYALWRMNISIDSDDPTEMPCCHRRVYFRQDIEIIEVGE